MQSNIFELDDKMTDTNMFCVLQQLIRNQMDLGLMYLEVGDITIKPPSFNPQNTLVSMTFKAAETETVSWVPTESSNPF